MNTVNSQHENEIIIFVDEETLTLEELEEMRGEINGEAQ